MNLYNPDNGYTEGQCTPGIAGQVCTFRCNSGYALEGLSSLTCLNGGQWNSMPPACRRTSGKWINDFVILDVALNITLWRICFISDKFFNDMLLKIGMKYNFKSLRTSWGTMLIKFVGQKIIRLSLFFWMHILQPFNKEDSWSLM